MQSLIHDLLISHIPKLIPAATLADFRKLVKNYWPDVQDVDFVDAWGQRLAPQTALINALPDLAKVRVSVVHKLDFAIDAALVLRSLGNEESVSAKSEHAPPSAEPVAEALIANFVRSFARLENVNDFMWIGYVLKTLLPEMGLSGTEAREFFARLEADGIVTTAKRPNPAKPDFPATTVQLNRNHPTVKQTLQNGKPRTFQPVKIPGGPLSDDIINDRR
ncbi:MAG: hypothetical protein CHACPFDD_01823 [Phycisphaerae bacterium]|nr:hypothetical protein [Phycisphaerae bacterium]